MERVYSSVELSTPRETPEREVPRLKPLFRETCLVSGLVDMVSVQGVLPRWVLILTTPEDMSPYSTEGTPVMTSTDSTLEEAMLLVVTPDTLVKEALFVSRTPSTSTAVLKEPPPRMEKVWLLVSVDAPVFPPGSSALMSVTFMTWTCSRATLSMVLDVAAELEFSLAVTTALSRLRLSRTRRKLTVKSLSTEISLVMVT